MKEGPPDARLATQTSQASEPAAFAQIYRWAIVVATVMVVVIMIVMMS